MDKMVKQAIAKLTQLESQDALKDARPVRKGTFGEGQFLYLAESLPYPGLPRADPRPRIGVCAGSSL
jgi:hypothetical protein